MAEITYKEAGATITYTEVVERAQAAVDHLANTIAVLDSLIAIIGTYSGDTGSNSWEYSTLSGRRLQPEGSVPYDVRRDHDRVLQGLSKLRNECAGRYPRAFEALDSKALLNFGCFGVVDLFESDLASRMREVRVRLATLLVSRKSALDAMVSSVAETSATIPGIMAVKDPALSRYLKQDHKTTSALVRDLDDIADRLDTIRKRNLAKIPSTPQPGQASDNQAFYDTSMGVTDVESQAQLDAANQVVLRSTSSALVASLTDWSGELLRAQYPISSEFCVEDGCDDPPYASTKDSGTAAVLTELRKEKAAASKVEATKSTEGLVERYTEMLQLDEEDKLEYAEAALEKSLLACQRVLNRLDVPLGRDDDTSRSLLAAGFRDRLSKLRAECRAAHSSTLKVSLCSKVDALTITISAALSTDSMEE